MAVLFFKSLHRILNDFILSHNHSSMFQVLNTFKLRKNEERLKCLKIIRTLKK